MSGCIGVRLLGASDVEGADGGGSAANAVGTLGRLIMIPATISPRMSTRCILTNLELPITASFATMQHPSLRQAGVDTSHPSE